MELHYDGHTFRLPEALIRNGRASLLIRWWIKAGVGRPEQLRFTQL